jgi:integrase
MRYASEMRGDESQSRSHTQAAGPKSTRGKLKIRYVPLFGLGLRAMRRWLELLPTYCPKNPLALVFPGPTGARRQPGKHLHVTRRDPETNKPQPVNPLLEYLGAAGIVIDQRHDRMPVRWHDLRHTCAAALVSGMWGRRWSLEEVKGLLGHESVTTTERYAHLAQSALKTAAAETGGPADKPTRKPTQKKKQDEGSGAKSLKSLRSHLRDLNSRPTVYETVALPLS